jgi:hypothetical protein
MRKIKICCLIVLIWIPASVPSAAVTSGEHSENAQELNRLLEKSSTDQIMLALEPSIEMPIGKIRDQIKLPVLWLNHNTFYLFISTSRSENPHERFDAFYGIPVSSAWGVTQHVEYIHHLGNITGQGSTSRDALVDMIKKLVAKGLIDPGRLVEKLKS